MDSLKYTMLSCLLVNTRSGFNSFGAKKKEIIDKKSRGQFIQMYKCVFLGNSSIEISPDGRIMIENSEISSLRLKADRRIYSYQFSSTETDYGSLSLNSPMIKTQFINSWVRKSLEIENPIRLIALILRKRELRYETMNGWNVNLSNLDSVESRTLISLAGLKMIESSDLYLPIGLKPSQLELNNYSIENTMIHLALDSTDLRNEYVNVGIYFEKLIQYYAENKSLDKDVKERIIERLKYQKALYKAKQISAEPFSISKIFRVTKMKFLKLTVNYGYKGEWQFTKTLLLFIFCWSLAYLFLFSDEVIQYIYVRDEKNEMIETDKENPSFLKLFFMCCWFSFIVFANPKFPSKYFLFSKRMFKWLLIEWFLGLFLLILFLVYIASKYSFIQKLFGF